MIYDVNKYFEEDAIRTDIQDYEAVSKRFTPEMCKLLHSAIGLAGEVGEVLDTLKKHLFYGQDLDMDNYIEELGDLGWYLALGMYHSGEFAEDIFKQNIEKLKARYPEKFSEKLAQERLDKTATVEVPPVKVGIVKQGLRVDVTGPAHILWKAIFYQIGDGVFKLFEDSNQEITIEAPFNRIFDTEFTQDQVIKEGGCYEKITFVKIYD